ncbi:MAG: polysaccharide biosynthesis tyrosine autokinase [Flavobacteriales bacterium]|nr:polysaccharide biosynthesis tyrosine autokinase [Flavobacteriales bacterium]
MAVAQNPKSGIIDVNDLRYVLRVFSKNWYFVVVAIVLSAILSYLYSYKIPEVYGASTRILLKDKDVYNYQKEVYKDIGYVAAYGDLMTQKRVLTSYDMIDRALNKLDFDVSYYIIGRFKTSEVYGSLPFTVKIDLLTPRLYERPFDLRLVDPDHFELSYDPGNGVVTKQYPFNKQVVEPDFLLTVTSSSLLTSRSIEKLSESTYQFVRHSRPWLVSKYAAGISIEALDYTSILEIKSEDEIAERAKMFLDTLSAEYREFNLRSEYEINDKTLAYIDRQLDEVTAILDQHEEELQRYMESKAILNLNREETRYFSEMVGFDNQKRGIELQIQSLAELENYVLTLPETEKLLPPAMYVLREDEYLERTLGSLYAMQMERNRDLYDAKEVNPGILRSDSTMQLVRGNLLVYIKNTKAAMRAKIEDLEAQIADYEGMIRGIPETQRDLLNIKRKVEVNEKLYVFLLEKRASTIIAKAGIIPGTKVIEAARTLGVVRPDKLKILYTFVFGGVLLSLIVVFIRIMFYDRVENAEQLKAATHLAVFGEIIQSDKAQNNYVVVDSDPKSAITESFRTIRTNLEYLPLPDTGRVVMLTSYRPNEGKTFCSVNLSAILARAGKRVLLLELDLHKPKVSKALNMNTAAGLSAVLAGKADPADCIMSTQIENLEVVLSGPTPPNASELVLSKKMVELLDRGRQHYDYIIIDTPPVGLITDALVLMKHVDATLFVVNTRFANRDHIRSAMEAIADSKARNFGFILNGVRMKKSKYYYNTNYGYGYRYAYGYGSGYGYGYGYGYTGRRSRRKKDGAEGNAPDGAKAPPKD